MSSSPNISTAQLARADADQSSPGATPSPAEALSNALRDRPRDLPAFLKSLSPYLSREFVEQLKDYERKIAVYTEQIGLADQSRADAEYDRRRNMVAENPTPDNLAILAQESHDELRKKFAERRNVFEGLLTACIRQYATALSRVVLPFVEKHAAAFRAQINADFKTLYQHYGVPYEPASNPAIRAVDQWLKSRQQTLTWEDHSREVRYPPGWEMSLPGPDFFRDVTGGNLTPAAAEPQAQTSSDSPPLRTAADIATLRAA